MYTSAAAEWVRMTRMPSAAMDVRTGAPEPTREPRAR
jgi:hypothetical protein